MKEQFDLFDLEVEDVLIQASCIAELADRIQDAIADRIAGRVRDVQLDTLFEQLKDPGYSEKAKEKIWELIEKKVLNPETESDPDLNRFLELRRKNPDQTADSKFLQRVIKKRTGLHLVSDWNDKVTGFSNSPQVPKHQFSFFSKSKLLSAMPEVGLQAQFGIQYAIPSLVSASVEAALSKSIYHSLTPSKEKLRHEINQQIRLRFSNIAYVVRHELEQDMTNWLQTLTRAGLVLLTGVTGSGKTTLVRDWVQSLEKQSICKEEDVYWMDAGDKKNFEVGQRRMAQLLDLNEDADLNQIKQALCDPKRTLAFGHWRVVVIDNVKLIEGIFESMKALLKNWTNTPNLLLVLTSQETLDQDIPNEFFRDSRYEKNLSRGLTKSEARELLQNQSGLSETVALDLIERMPYRLPTELIILASIIRHIGEQKNPKQQSPRALTKSEEQEIEKIYADPKIEDLLVSEIVRWWVPEDTVEGTIIEDPMKQFKLPKMGIAEMLARWYDTIKAEDPEDESSKKAWQLLVLCCVLEGSHLSRDLLHGLMMELLKGQKNKEFVAEWLLKKCCHFCLLLEPERLAYDEQPYVMLEGIQRQILWWAIKEYHAKNQFSEDKALDSLKKWVITVLEKYFINTLSEQITTLKAFQLQSTLCYQLEWLFNVGMPTINQVSKERLEAIKLALGDYAYQCLNDFKKAIFWYKAIKNPSLENAKILRLTLIYIDTKKYSQAEELIKKIFLFSSANSLTPFLKNLLQLQQSLVPEQLPSLPNTQEKIEKFSMISKTTNGCPRWLIWKIVLSSGWISQNELMEKEAFETLLKILESKLIDYPEDILFRLVVFENKGRFAHSNKNYQEAAEAWKAFTQLAALRERYSNPAYYAVEKNLPGLLKYLLDDDPTLLQRQRSDQSLLSIVSLNGYYECAEILLSQPHVEVDVANFVGITPLMLACTENHPQIAHALINKGANVNVSLNKERAFGPNILYITCVKGYIDCVKLLLNSPNIIVDAQDINGVTPLMVACAWGHTEIVKQLLTANANTEQQNVDGITPLCAAIMFNHEDIMNLLLQNGAQIESFFIRLSTRNRDQLKNLLKASGHEEEQLRNVIKEMGLPEQLININFSNWDSALTFVMKTLGIFPEKFTIDLLSIACLHNNPSLVRRLIKMGCSVNSLNEFKESPLITACSYGHTLVVKVLLDAGADVKHSDSKGITALHAALLKGDIDLVELLLATPGIIVDAQGINGITPLMVACVWGRTEIVKHLLKAGANIEQQNGSGETSLYMAVSFNHEDVVNLLLQSGAKVHPLSQSPITGLQQMQTILESFDKEQLREIFQAQGLTFPEQLIDQQINILDYISTNPKLRDKLSQRMNISLLTTACMHNNPSLVKRLIKEGCDVNHQNEMGYSPLMTACLYGNALVVKTLLDAGADVNLTIVDEKATALHIACGNGYLDCVKFLLEAPNSTVDPRSAGEITPLFFACLNGYPEVVKLLVAKGADVNALAEVGAPLHAACGAGNLECVKALLEAPNININAVSGSKHNINIAAFMMRDVTPLILACEEQNFEIVNVLIDKGADVLLSKETGETPILIALRKKHHPILERLVRAMRLDDESYRNCISLMEIDLQNPNNLAKRLPYAKTLVRLAPKMPENWSVLGCYYQIQRKFKKANDCFLQALSLIEDPQQKSTCCLYANFLLVTRYTADYKLEALKLINKVFYPDKGLYVRRIDEFWNLTFSLSQYFLLEDTLLGKELLHYQELSFPSHFLARWLLGSYFAIKNSDPTLVDDDELLTNARKLELYADSSGDDISWVICGNLYFNIEEYKKAEECFSKVKNPSELTLAHKKMSSALSTEKLGDKQKSKIGFFKNVSKNLSQSEIGESIEEARSEEKKLKVSEKKGSSSLLSKNIFIDKQKSSQRNVMPPNIASTILPLSEKQQVAIATQLSLEQAERDEIKQPSRPLNQTVHTQSLAFESSESDANNQIPPLIDDSETDKETNEKSTCNPQ